MKKTLLIFISALSGLAAFAQSPVEIKGSLEKEFLKPVKLFKVVEGNAVEIATSTPQGEGKFGFIFYPQYEGLYALGTGNSGSPNDNYKFYFKSGDKLSVRLLDSSYVLTGTENSKENQILAQWHDLVFPLEQKAINFMKVQSTFVDFFPDLESITEKAKGFEQGKLSGNLKFDKHLKSYMNSDLALYATNFLSTPRSAHPATDELSPFYETIKAKDFATTTQLVYENPWGRRLLSGIIMLNMKQEKIKYAQGIQGVKDQFVFLPNDTLKGDAVLDAVSRLKTFEAYKEIMDQYGSLIVTSSQKKRNMDIMAELAQLKAGDAGLNFAYPDPNGKTVKFEDLRGKVVLIDVWATWCGPCKAEIPYLKKLEEEMKGTNLQIVSISVDEAKDKAKWAKMIKDENLGGLQLFASGWGDLAQYYKIKGIPRFMIFDKEGKIVTTDSPRPSNPELKTLLNKILQQ